MNANNQDLIFKQKMVKLLRIFNKHPHMLADFLIKNNAINSTFKKKLIRSYLKDKKHNNFLDIEKMINYYENLLNETEKDPLKNEEYWNIKLNDAIIAQKYEDAANIRDYMLLKKIVIKIKHS